MKRAAPRLGTGTPPSYKAKDFTYLASQTLLTRRPRHKSQAPGEVFTMGKLPAHIRAVANKPTHKPSLPRFKCLDHDVDDSDVAAGALVAAVGVELHDAIVARAQRQKAERNRAKADKRKPAKESPVAPVELLVAVEAPPQDYTPDPPVIAPRIRSGSSAKHRRIPKSATVVAIELDHPYRIPVAAERVEPPAGSSLNGHGPAEWQTPPPVTVTVATTARGDVASYMYARHQIGKSEFLAAKQYQAIYETASPARVRSVDVSMPPTGIRGAAGNYGPADAQMRAAARLEKVHAQLNAHVGDMGVHLVTDVLAFGSTIEACAIARGDGDDKQAVRFWGSLFRRCLRHLAVVLGFSTSAAPRS
jgi:hypothetical protein